jgi:hypothetical protein
VQDWRPKSGFRRRTRDTMLLCSNGAASEQVFLENYTREQGPQLVFMSNSIVRDRHVMNLQAIDS